MSTATDQQPDRVSGELMDRVRNRLADLTGDPSPAVVAAALRAETSGLLGDAQMLSAVRTLQTELSGLGPLDPILAQPGVSDVLVTGPGQVWVDQGSGLRRIPLTFPDEAAVRRLAQRLALRAGRRLDDAQPWVDGNLASVVDGTLGVRLHAVLAPVARGGSCLSLRVLRPASGRLEHLINSGAITPEGAELLRRIVHARLAMLVVGGTGAGKTTVLSALLAEVPETERIVCVEDAAELAPAHPHLVTLVARAANVEGAGEVTVRDLVRQALRMRPDRIVVGEVRGAEVVDLLAALNTGHDGGAGTVHANAPDELPARLEALGALGGLSRAALHSQLGAAVQVVVFVRRRPDGTRTVAQIGVVCRRDDGLVQVEPAWPDDTAVPAARERLTRLLEMRELQ